MVAAGILAEDDRLELWDGQLITMSPIGPLHANAVRRLTELIYASKLPHTIVCVQDPISLGAHYMPQPDLALINRDREAADRTHPRPHDIHLIIEVSDTTLESDLGPKARVYARAEIREYSAVDVPAQRVTVHRAPQGGTYTSVSTPYCGGHPLKPDAFPNMAFPVSAIFA
jgi:Uma2 family endonuclease